MPISSRRMTAAAVTVLAATALAACSSGADSRQPEGTTSASKTVTPMDRLNATKAVVDKAGSMRLALSSKGVPETATGVLTGNGFGTSTPAFKGTMTARVQTVQAEVPVVAIGEQVWAKLPIWPTMRKTDVKQYGAPNPAVFFTKDRGISSLLPKTKNAKFGTERRDGADVVRPITGQLAGQDVVNLMAIGNPALTYNVEYLVTDKNQLRSAALTGVFFNDATTTYTLRLDQYGVKVAISAPA